MLSSHTFISQNTPNSAVKPLFHLQQNYNWMRRLCVSSNTSNLSFVPQRHSWLPFSYLTEKNVKFLETYLKLSFQTGINFAIRQIGLVLNRSIFGLVLS